MLGYTGALCDCVGMPGLDEVMCYAWRGDNYGPAGAAEVRDDFWKFGRLFPNAVVQASTLGDFFQLIEGSPALRAALPTLSSELGDTWMYGCSSDPLKLAKMRAMQRAFTQCHAAGRCGVNTEPHINMFVHYALKLFEHTWGGSTSHHMNVTRAEVEHVWTTEQMRRAKADGTYKFIGKMESTWDEQRLYIDKALDALGPPAQGSNSNTNTNTNSSTSSKTTGSALAAAIQAEFAILTAPAPSIARLLADNFSAVPPNEWADPIQMGRLTIAFDRATGALVRLDSTAEEEGTGWASPINPIGRVVYKSHSYTEWDTFVKTYMYTHQGEHPYAPTPSSFLTCKQMNNCTTVGKAWHASIVGMWHRAATVGSRAKAVVQLAFPASSQEAQGPAAAGYGVPARVFVTV